MPSLCMLRSVATQHLPSVPLHSDASDDALRLIARSPRVCSGARRATVIASSGVCSGARRATLTSSSVLRCTRGTSLRDCDLVLWFWDVVMAFSEAKKRRFLQFVTGNTRPVGGLGSLVPKFKIVKNGEHSSRLPTAHVCFNVLLLPQYASKEWLADRLEKAIENDQGFGLA